MAGVYISYPFCTQKCTFCNFSSGVALPETKRRYTERLRAEMRAHDWQWAPQTLYFGGGTPSLMPPDELQALMSLIPSANLREVTLECAPGTVTREAAARWRELGVNRVSLGVQSFITGELRQTGRQHTAQTVAADTALLRDAGIGNINIDLIAGLPGQTAASWAESLDWVERLAPPHVSVYIFEIDDESRLGKEALLGGIRYGAAMLPGDDLVAALYEYATERLGGAGLTRYEISNFARVGFRSSHNLKYWRLEPYAGFGLDAHSFDGARRWSNSDDMEEYLTDSDKPERTTTDHAEELMFVGLRLSDGVALSPAERSRFAEPIARWTEAGLLEETGGVLRLSNRGVLLSNEVLQDFVNA